MTIRRVTQDELELLAAAARQAGRRRQNRNLHAALTDPVQRLLNALEPGTYVRPHRHGTPAKWELMAWLTGQVVLLTFDDAGVVQERIELDERTPVIEIPPQTWHTLAALVPRSILLEVKPGPYAPVAQADMASWAPAEGGTDAAMLERWFRIAAPGERAPHGPAHGL